MAVQVELKVPCSGYIHTVQVRLESWEQWKVLTSDCIELMGRAFGMMAECYHSVKARGLEVRLQAVERLQDARAVPLIIQALQDEDWEVRAAACRALGMVRDAAAVPALLQALKDGDWSVRVAACEALGVIGDPAAVPALIEAMKDPWHIVREKSCWALGMIRDPRAVPALIEATNEWDPWIRHAAQEALERIQRK